MKISKDFYYLNFLANILVVLVFTLLVGLLAYRIFFQPYLGSLEAELLSAGDDFKGLQEVNFSKNSNTILLVLDAKCQYCTQSLAFYKKLIVESKEKSNVWVIAVFKIKAEEVEHYLKDHGINIEFIPNVNLVELKVDATPTIIWVDANRKIVGSYEGVLNEKQESTFFEFYEKRLSGR